MSILQQRNAYCVFKVQSMVAKHVVHDIQIRCQTWSPERQFYAKLPQRKLEKAFLCFGLYLLEEHAGPGE